MPFNLEMEAAFGAVEGAICNLAGNALSSHKTPSVCTFVYVCIRLPPGQLAVKTSSLRSLGPCNFNQHAFDTTPSWTGDD
jgi:hypothetical protein